MVLKELKFSIKDESAMMDFAARMSHCLTASKANHLSKGQLIFLEGDLGAGKTTFVRGFLRKLGYNGAVKSPTFTLVESYSIVNQEGVKQERVKQEKEELNIFHFDLYRLTDPEELDYMGITDYFDGEAIVLIEWPDKGQGFLPLADLVINIAYLGKGREIVLSTQTEKGKQLMASIKANNSDLIEN
jgi:tRNA threonylcarbamoyladenosine biosynthesis protein TsaE